MSRAKFYPDPPYIDDFSDADYHEPGATFTNVLNLSSAKHADITEHYVSEARPTLVLIRREPAPPSLFDAMFGDLLSNDELVDPVFLLAISARMAHRAIMELGRDNRYEQVSGSIESLSQVVKFWKERNKARPAKPRADNVLKLWDTL